MKIIVVGARGMLGTDLMKTVPPGHDMVGLDLAEIDITSPEQCLSMSDSRQPDVIVNAAAYTRVDDCETNRDLAFAVNGHGAGNLAQAAQKAGALIVHYSTDYVFDGKKQGPYLEEDLPNPGSVYGRSKLLGEELVRAHCENHLILRTSWLFGRSGPNFIRTILEAAEAGRALRVVDDQRGCPTYSKDLAAHTMQLIEAGCRGTYHLTNRGVCTWFELASQSLVWAGIQTKITPVKTSEFPRPAPRPANSTLANARLEREGFPLMRPWQESAREYVLENLVR